MRLANPLVVLGVMQREKRKRKTAAPPPGGVVAAALRESAAALRRAETRAEPSSKLPRQIKFLSDLHIGPGASTQMGGIKVARSRRNRA